MRKIILISASILINVYSFAQIDNKPAIVRISAINEFDDIEIASGIIVGSNETKLYIVTAYHTVKNSPEIDIYFYKIDEPNKATVIQFDEDMDIAVLELPIPKNVKFTYMVPASKSIIKVNKEVDCIGQPEGSYWKSYRINKIQEVAVYNEPNIMTITSQGVTRGFSGGGVFTLDGIWLGMIIESTNIEAFCIKANFIIEYLRELNIPTNLTLPKEPATVYFESGVRELVNYKETIEVDFESAFSVGSFLVSYQEFKLFIAATGHITDYEVKSIEAGKYKWEHGRKKYEYGDKFKTWHYTNEGKIQSNLDFDIQVYNINCSDVFAYCRWLSDMHGVVFRLLNNTEWFCYYSVFGKSKEYEFVADFCDLNNYWCGAITWPDIYLHKDKVNHDTNWDLPNWRNPCNEHDIIAHSYANGYRCFRIAKNIKKSILKLYSKNKNINTFIEFVKNEKLKRSEYDLSPHAFILLGGKLIDKDDYNNALIIFQLMKELYPDKSFEEYLEDYADTQRQLDLNEFALQLSKIITVLYPSWKSYYNLGRYYMDLGEVEESVAALEKSLELEPGDEKYLVEDLLEKLKSK